MTISNDVLMNPNELVQFLQKPAHEFSRNDLIRFIEAKGITMINFRYAAEDGKLKSLSFVPHNRDHLISILTAGERVDGSNLFPFVDPDSSDLYVIPKYRTAFVNPFSKTPSLDILCSFYNSSGAPLNSIPENILRKAYFRFTKKTGYRLRAFGNTIPTSYLRLVPHQEAPVNICWGDRNRSVLVRVPLGWNGAMNMIRDANPADISDFPDMPVKQTVELRSPDGSADLYRLFAGIVVAVEHGLEMPDSLRMAEELYVSYNIFSKANKASEKKLESLPSSCWDSAENLLSEREFFEKDGVFPPEVIDFVVAKLKAYDDKNLRERLFKKEDEISTLVRQFLHCS